MLIPYSKCLEIANKKFDYVIHIGAHLGEEAQDYASLGVKKAFWFEANRNLMSPLFDHVNRIRPRDDYFCETLFNEDDKELQFKVTNNGQSSSLLELGTHSQHYPHITVTRTINVKTKRFDSFQKNNKEKFALAGAGVFLNLDVQGVEYEVLQGFGDLLSSNNKDFIIEAVYTEVNFEEVYKDAKTMTFLNDLLGSFGFKNVATHPTQYGWGDALYLRK